MNPYGQFRGPGPSNALVRTLDNVPINGQNVKSVLGFRLYDQYRFVAGTAVSTAPFSFFQVQQGQTQAGQNFATTYTKTLIDTNMIQGGQLPKGQFLQVHSMQVRILMMGATDTTYASSGIGTQLPTNAAGAATISATNELAEILEAGILSIVIDNVTYEQNKFIHFPTPYGMSGFAGGGIPGTANTDTVAVANNGFGRPYRLPVPRNIDGLRAFRADAQFPYAFTPNRNFRMEVCFEEILWRPIAG